MQSIFYKISGSIGDSLEKINTNYLNLDLLIGDENKTDSFIYKTKNLQVLYNAYDQYKDLFQTLIDNWDQIDDFCTLVEENSAKWLTPCVFAYPFIENSKIFTASNTAQTQIFTKIINWVNVAYPVSINIENCNSSAEYVEGQVAYIQFYLNVDNTTLDSPTPDLTSDSGYCTTTEYDTCINCQRLYHGYTFCGTGQIFDCEGASIEFTSCGTVKCTFSGPYEKIKMIDNSEDQSFSNATEQVKSTITSVIRAHYENKKEYTFLQTIKAEVVGCQWVFKEWLPSITFNPITMDYHWCELHQKYDECPIDPKMLLSISGPDDYGGGYGEDGLAKINNHGLPIPRKLPKFIRDILDSTKEDGTTIINL